MFSSIIVALKNRPKSYVGYNFKLVNDGSMERIVFKRKFSFSGLFYELVPFELVFDPVESLGGKTLNVYFRLYDATANRSFVFPFASNVVQSSDLCIDSLLRELSNIAKRNDSHIESVNNLRKHHFKRARVDSRVRKCINQPH